MTLGFRGVRGAKADGMEYRLRQTINHKSMTKNLAILKQIIWYTTKENSLKLLTVKTVTKENSHN